MTIPKSSLAEFIEKNCKDAVPVDSFTLASNSSEAYEVKPDALGSYHFSTK